MASDWLRITKLKLAALAYRVYDPSTQPRVNYGPGSSESNSSWPLQNDFQHERLDHPAVAAFCESLEEVLGETTDPFEICDRLRRLTEHGLAEPSQGTDNPRQLLELARQGVPFTCRPFALLLGHALLARGYTTRMLGMSRAGKKLGHAATEVYLPRFGQWVLIDCDFNVAYRRNERWMSALDLQRVWIELREKLSVDAATDAEQALRIVEPHKLESAGIVSVEVVPLGEAGEKLRATNMHRGSVTGINLEYAHYLFYSHRNDYLGAAYPPGHPKAVLQYFLAAEPGAMRPPLIPEAIHLVDDKELINWPVGRTEIRVEPNANDVEIALTLSTWMPNFSHFEKSVDGKAWKKRNGRSDRLSQATCEQVQYRAVNLGGLSGEPASLRTWKATAVN